MLEIIVLGLCVVGAIIVDRFTPAPKTKPAQVGEIVYLSRQSMIADCPVEVLQSELGNWHMQDQSIN